MVDLEKINAKHIPKNPIGQFSKTAGRFAIEVIELSELQASLARNDIEEVVNKSAGSIAGAVVGSSLLLASLPVMLLGFASATAWYFEIELWTAQMLVGGIVAILGILIVAIAARGLLRLKNAFERSISEFKKNTEWVKRVIQSIS